MAATDYGTDLACVTDLDPNMAEITGRRVLAEALARRLTCPRGGLIDDPTYGYDLRAFLNADIDTPTLSRIAGQVAAECLKDERVVGCSASVLFPSAGIMVVTVNVTDFAGPFPLVLSITAVNVTILAGH